MSYILDALKKMEQEKNMKAAPKERINLSGALLKDDLRPSGRKITGRRVGVILIALIAASGVIWYFLHKPSKVAVTAAPQVAVNPLPQQKQAMPSPAPQPQAVSPAPPGAVPLPSSVSVVAPLSAKRRAIAAAQVSPEASEEETTTPVPTPSAHKTDTPPVQAAQTSTSASTAPVASTMAAPANIKISGIAWQDERSARRAVVNDFLMKEGNVVSGAKIIEIKQDRVRFSLSGSMFEVPLLS
ncbi:MAG: hypothetical protein A2079_03730, partial [Geobacteraceae bacterium GWC2_48_7]